MKVNKDTVNKYLTSNEEVLSSLYCSIQLGYISRTGILAATNEKLLFCADYMFGKGLKWEFYYSDISNFEELNGFVQGTVPFIPKITMYHQQQDFIVFTGFTDQSKVNDFFKVVASKLID